MTRGSARRFASLNAGLILTGIGLLCGGFAAFVLLNSVGSAFRDALLSPPCTTPCAEDVGMDTGRYVVFERVGHSASSGPFTSTVIDKPVVTPADVSVTSKSGSQLDVRRPGVTQTLDRNGVIYRGVATFRITSADRYRIDVEAPRGTGIIVAPDLGHTFLQGVPGLLLGLLAGLILASGLVVLLVVWTRRPSGDG